MRSSHGFFDARVVPSKPHEDQHLTPVWVLLESINVRIPGMPKHVVPDGLDMTGQVRGLLRRWHRTVAGDWLGVVTFSIPYADGRRDRLTMNDHLVPAYALRPREDDTRDLGV